MPARFHAYELAVFATFVLGVADLAWVGWVLAPAAVQELAVSRGLEAPPEPPAPSQPAPPPLPRAPAPPPPERTPPAPEAALPEAVSIRFDTARAELAAEAQARLRAVAATMAARPELELVATGHADKRGAPEVNIRLSRSRAETVKSFLLAEGVTATRVIVEAMGAEHPLDPADSPEAWMKNRRVELTWRN